MSHLFTKGERNNERLVESIRIQRDWGGDRRIRKDRGRDREGKCGVFKSPCEESVISQAKCEWLTRLSEGGESRPWSDRGVFSWRKETSRHEVAAISTLICFHFKMFLNTISVQTSLFVSILFKIQPPSILNIYHIFTHTWTCACQWRLQKIHRIFSISSLSLYYS